MKSGPLAAREKAEIRAFDPKLRELVVHSKEWTTGYPEKGGNRAFDPKLREPVVHFEEWTTGFLEKG